MIFNRIGARHQMTTYMKLLSQGSKRHLMKPDQLEQGITLCGCVVTRVVGVRRISALEGDECSKCAERSFCAPSQRASAADSGDRGVRG
jgi:hypothetical protein